MKMHNGKMRVNLLVVAVQGALIAMCAMPAHAEDDEAAALKNPTNTLEVGASDTSTSSAKFGEYNGLNKSGGNVVGNFSVSGGDAYGESNGTKRWAITGNDLGTTSRALGASVDNQGKWSLGIGYDELTHNLWDSYKTPYVGSMGGNSFTLPAGFALISTAANGTTPVGTDGTTNLGAINAVFRQVDVATTRKNGSVGAGVNLNPQWDVRFDFNHLDQSGAKLMAFPALGLGSATNNTPKGEAISILPNPTNYKTDTINLALNWKGDQGHMTASYFGSYFREGYDRVDFATFAVGNANGTSQVQTMSTAPGNDFHQLNVKGGYDVTSATKLTGGLSYGRNTQNDAYVFDAYSMVTAAPPQASLNGRVDTTHADLKVTNQTNKELVLSASLKFDERKDKTASQFYNFLAVDGAHPAIFPNTPYSNRKTQLEVAGDYRLRNDQHLRLAYNREDVKRWCDQYAVSTGILAGASGYYPAGTNCVVATASKDDKLSATYKLLASDSLNLNVGYSYSKRTTESDPNAITARIGTNGNATLAAGNTLIWGINAGDFRGFYPVFDASRKQQMLKAGANWQANEKLSVSLGGKYTDDKYDSLYGVQNGSSASLNLDATYGYSDTGSISAYMTQQSRQREMTDLQKSPTTQATTTNGASATAIAIPPGATWTDKQKDDDTTIGVGAKQNGLMGTKLEIDEDLTYTLGKTGYSTKLNYATTTTGGLTCSDVHILSCGALPEINNKVVQFKLTGKYKLDKSSKVVVGYIYQHMNSNDYYYNGLQAGSTPSALMPTNQQSPNYTVNYVTASYLYNF